jgi:hypothetical protein
VKLILGLAFAWLGLVSASAPPAVNDALILGDTLPPKLSDFKLLLGRQGMTPNGGVKPYRLNTPLFSDYAEKWRYLYLPQGSKLGWTGDGLPAFPIGAVLVKSFGYPADMRKPDDAIRILETRLLVNRASGWVALPYVWNADGSDALLKRAGTRIDVRWIHTDGGKRSISYAVPNANQCKGCHDVAGAIMPIGPKARNLVGNPAGIAQIPVWNDPKTGMVAARARAYLDVNCGHCHNPKGPASNSGLNLVWQETSDVARGIGKRPVAAGRASADLSFDVVPGHPERSIMLHRLESTEPGIAMPELGRAAVHKEGIALLSEWIKSLPEAKP